MNNKLQPSLYGPPLWDRKSLTLALKVCVIVFALSVVVGGWLLADEHRTWSYLTSKELRTFREFLLLLAILMHGILLVPLLIGLIFVPVAIALAMRSTRRNLNLADKRPILQTAIASASMLLPWVYLQSVNRGISPPRPILYIAYGILHLAWFAGSVFYWLWTALNIMVRGLLVIPAYYFYDLKELQLDYYPSSPDEVLKFLTVVVGALIPLTLFPLIVASSCFVSWWRSLQIFKVLSVTVTENDTIGSPEGRDWWPYVAPFTMTAVWAAIGPVFFVGWAALPIAFLLKLGGF